MTPASNPFPSARSSPWVLVALFAAGLSLAGCNKLRKTDLTPLDKAGVLFNDVDQLRALNINDAEVQEVIAARQGGVSEQACLDLIRLAHERNQQFMEGHDAANLIRAGMQEPSVVELARLNQLGRQTGEMQAMRLARLSDRVILAIAARRAATRPTLSGPSAAALQNAEFTEPQILAQINSGATDSDATAMVARRNAAAVSHGFVRQTRRRRR